MPEGCPCGDGTIDPGEACDGFTLGSCTACAFDCTCAPDADLDGRTDVADNCPYTSNPLQDDTDFDESGDPCDCGDVTDDGLLTSADIDELRDVLAARLLLLSAPQKCNVRGPTDLADDDSDGRPNDCDLVDAVVASRELAALDPGLAPVCAPALP
jgi:hypothetical protein